MSDVEKSKKSPPDAATLAEELRRSVPGEQAQASQVIPCGAKLKGLPFSERPRVVPDGNGSIEVWSGDPPHPHRFVPKSLLDSAEARIVELEAELRALRETSKELEAAHNKAHYERTQLEERARQAEAALPEFVQEWRRGPQEWLVVEKDQPDEPMRRLATECLRWLARAPASQIARIGLPKSAAEAVREYQRVGCSVWEMADALEGVEVYDVSEVVPLLRAAVHGHDENSDSDDVTGAWEALPEQWKKLVASLG